MRCKINISHFQNQQKHNSIKPRFQNTLRFAKAHTKSQQHKSNPDWKINKEATYIERRRYKNLHTFPLGKTNKTPEAHNPVCQGWFYPLLDSTLHPLAGSDVLFHKIAELFIWLRPCYDPLSTGVGLRRFASRSRSADFPAREGWRFSSPPGPIGTWFKLQKWAFLRFYPI